MIQGAGQLPHGLGGLSHLHPGPAEEVPGLDDQLALEVFYRASVGRYGALTIDLQYINDPAINPTESSIWMFNLRGRVAF